MCSWIQNLSKKFMASNEPSVITGIICFCVYSETPNKNECPQFYLNSHGNFKIYLSDITWCLQDDREWSFNPSYSFSYSGIFISVDGAHPSTELIAAVDVTQITLMFMYTKGSTQWLLAQNSTRISVDVHTVHSCPLFKAVWWHSTEPHCQ